ncbi:MAG: S41 family peptidase [Candidatus Omnitrophica bacterium]|nr:S41 family peptidase [Candidatus Omnitrophota bacterium]
MKLPNSKKIFLWILLCGFLLYFVGAVLSEDNKISRNLKDQTYEELSLFADTLSIIQSQYVDETKPKELVYGALKGMLSSLDPYSEFLTPEEYNELKSNTEGRFGGVGMEITLKDGLVTVVSPIENTPAWNAGIKSGDIIVKIDGKIIKGYTLTDAVRALRGQEGTEVKVTVWRQGLKELLELKLRRAIIKLEDIKDTRIVEPGIGYIRLVEFSSETPRDMVNALKNLKSQNMKALVLDLRNNPGGLLNTAADIAELFLDNGKMIVYTKGRGDFQTLEFISKKPSAYKDLLMVVLINEGSASGSEILAGALQDHKRAIIVGQKTFGKGSVQTIVPLSDNSAIKLTTSKYFTPLGRSIHGEGIEPDIKVESLQLVKEPKDIEDLPEEIAETFEDKKEQEDSFTQKYKTDNQLIRAVDILKGLLIYKQS